MNEYRFNCNGDDSLDVVVFSGCELDGYIYNSDGYDIDGFYCDECE